MATHFLLHSAWESRSVHHCLECMIVHSVQLLLKDIREAMKEAILFLLVSVHMNASILGQVIELINVVHHCHTPLS